MLHLKKEKDHLPVPYPSRFIGSLGFFWSPLSVLHLLYTYYNTFYKKVKWLFTIKLLMDSKKKWLKRMFLKKN